MRYVDFLRASGYFDTTSFRSTMDRLTPTPSRETSPALNRNADTNSVEGTLVPRPQRQPPEKDDGGSLAVRIEALMVHLSEVWHSGMIAFFPLARSRHRQPPSPSELRLGSTGSCDVLVRQFSTFGRLSTKAPHILARALCRLVRALVILTIPHSHRRHRDLGIPV